MSGIKRPLFYAAGLVDSRTEMKSRIRRLPAEVQEALKKGALRLVDTVLYNTKPLLKTTRMFEEKDKYDLGICNVNGAKLEKNQCMLVTGLQFKVLPVYGDLKPNVFNASQDAVEYYGAVATGEFSMKIDRRIVIPETSNMVFWTEGESTGLSWRKFHKLANPLLIKEGEMIDLTVELATTTGFPEDSTLHLRVELFGTITTP
jgi:hypothetical protein